MKIVTIVGARPQFIKAATVSRAIQAHDRTDRTRLIQEIIVHTGQHYDHNMSRVFFDELQIPKPRYNLGIGSGNHGEMTAAMLAGIERVLLDERPDIVLVYGDTNSTLAGALAAVKLHLPVAHVEAGLRSFNRRMPEEINRLVTDHISDFLFCPTQTAIINLAAEGIDKGVYQVGDVMYDAVLYYRQKAEKPKIKSDFALATLHRAENTDDHSRLRQIISAMNASPVPVVLPLHPRTRKVLARLNLNPGSQITIMNPLSYFSMLGHLDQCRFVMTDSGGLQKEAYFFKKKCITLRDETEWVELVQSGANRTVGAENEKIVQAYTWAMQPLGTLEELYGNGNAAQNILNRLIRFFSDRGLT